MDEAIIWNPTVNVCLNKRTRNFTLLRYAAREGFGASYVVGPLLPVSKGEMNSRGLEIVLQALRFYKMWPANTNFTSELKTMGAVKRSRFIAEHRLVSVFQEGNGWITIEPQHRTGGGWRGITGY